MKYKELVLKKIAVLVFAISLGFALCLSACNLSLAQDITPPPGYQPTVIQETVEPASTSSTAPEGTQPPPAADDAGVSASGEEVDEGEAVSTTEVEEESMAGGTVFGSVVNGSGGELPDDLEVTLYGYEQFEAVAELTTEVDDAGRFAFEGVDMAEDFIFFAVVEYMDMSYISKMHRVIPGETHVELSVDIYEATTDTSALVVDRLHVFFTYPTPDTVQVVQTMSISNPGNKTVIPTSETEPSLRYILPEGATNLFFNEGGIGQPYVLTVDGFGDPQPILPGMGEYQILYFYELPYSRKMAWVQPLTLTTNVVVLFLPDSGLKITGDQVEVSGTETFNETVYRAYVGGEMAAGDEIEIEISGRNPSAGTGLAFGTNTTSIIVGALGLALAGIGVWWWFRLDQAGESKEDDGENPEEIMDEIIALDEKYEAGKMDEAVYKKRRDALKARLSKLVE
jgi:hypothetical protein